MELYLDVTGSVEAFLAGLEMISEKEKVKSMLILAANNEAYTPESINDILKKQSLPLIGGKFTAIIHEREAYEKGVLIIGLEHELSTCVIGNMSEETTQIDEIIEEQFGTVEDSNSVFVFVDGYANRIGTLIESLFNSFGLNMNFIGGGAGVVNPKALEMGTQPCLFTNNGFIQDSAILGFTNMNMGIGVKHGWNSISGPYKVTESAGNAIKTIGWKPAMKVYKEIIEKHSGQKITSDNFFEVAKSYPFGLKRMGAEIVVRDPFTSDGNSIILATPIPSESFIDVLNGDINTLVDSAKEAKETSEALLGDSVKNAMFLVDCVSRSLYFGDLFNKELEAVKIPDVPMFGVLSMGEIANVGNDYMEFFNKTCVVGVFEA